MNQQDIPEIEINHAILHILDFTTQLNVLSQQELDLNADMIYGYVFQHIYRTLEDASQHHVSFEETANLLSALRDYRQGKSSFIDLSDAIAERFIGFFQDHPDLQAFDLLIADYTVNFHKYVSFYVLENSQAWTHQVDNSSGILKNDIIEHHAVLPSPTKKAKTYATINLSTEEIRYCDTMKTGADKNPKVLYHVMECTENKSASEVVKIIKEIVSDVAEEHDENPSLLLSQTKNFIMQSTEESSSFELADLSREIFEDKPEMKEVFRERAASIELPERVDIGLQDAKKMSARQKIRTDNGIEISVPVEFFSDPDYVRFINNPDGTITIELRHIGKIIHRK